MVTDSVNENDDGIGFAGQMLGQRGHVAVRGISRTFQGAGDDGRVDGSGQRHDQSPQSLLHPAFPLTMSRSSHLVLRAMIQPTPGTQWSRRAPSKTPATTGRVETAHDSSP
jgi:hypothetical protein